MPPHFYSCFLFAGRQLGRLHAELSPTHCWHGLGRDRPAIPRPRRHPVILGRALEEQFLLSNLPWETGGNRMCASNRWSPRASLPICSDELSLEDCSFQWKYDHRIVWVGKGFLRSPGPIWCEMLASALPEQSHLLTTPTSHIHPPHRPVHSDSVSSFVLPC